MLTDPLVSPLTSFRMATPTAPMDLMKVLFVLPLNLVGQFSRRRTKLFEEVDVPDGGRGVRSLHRLFVKGAFFEGKR